MLAVSYDTTYDNAALSLNDVSCSDGANGLETKYKYTTLGDVPVFPLVGGAQAIAGWNDANVSSCLPPRPGPSAPWPPTLMCLTDLFLSSADLAGQSHIMLRLFVY